ncbi:hypothetical protein RHMOL_Rhmol04G0382500 [Rhododendron molle]|uniref:Uncharacterized protein n=1 Tax=Rhododendron molle TaxID=49168 RepID=A0ACC0P9Y4_RHOML|nr:hypothetical protein RHMOL_Rhmol04G0382500 [Rhododendron molle]
MRQPLIQYKIGNGTGTGTFLWYDNWHSFGPLHKRFGKEVVFKWGGLFKLRCLPLFCQGEWRWPRLRNRVTQEIIRHTPPNLRPDSLREDCVVWVPHPSGKYFVPSA